jgi:ribonuclease VapC
VISFVTDTSAIIALLNDEQEAHGFRKAFNEADAAFVSAATLLETSCVVSSGRFARGGERLESLVDLLALTSVAFDEAQFRLAQAAYARYGRGSGHRASLNMGDCFSYALAKSRNLPLLFKGDDFVHTDVRPALPLTGEPA